MAKRLTIYTDKFDSRENVVGNGMSGKVFLDMVGEDEETHGETGQEFQSLDDAMEAIGKMDRGIDSLDVMYLASDGTQRYARFLVNTRCHEDTQHQLSRSGT